MDQERTYSVLFLVLFVFLFPCIHSSVRGKDYSTSTGNLIFEFLHFSVEKSDFHCKSSLIKESLRLSSGAAVILSLLAPKSNSSVSCGREFSFSFQVRNNRFLFLPSEQLLLDEATVLAVKFEPLIIAKPFLKFSNGRNRYLAVRLLRPRNRIKKPVLSANFNLRKQFLPFLHAGFSASKEAGNHYNTAIKNRSFEISKSDSSQFENQGKKDIVLGVYTPVLAIMSIFSAIWAYFKKVFKKKKETPDISPPGSTDSSQDPPVSNLLAGFHRFTYRELSLATRDFHHSGLLGRGRYASVYRAIFPRSVIMYAVKRFNQRDTSKYSFDIEVTAIHRLRHEKILELRGWCNENPNEPLLLYDYMHNKSLYEALRNRYNILIWPLRYKIAVGVAEALVYLHEECLPPVIHSDIKEGNVMLDVDFNPKLGDFGLAMSVPPYTLRRETTERDPPECQPCEEVTVKLDVYLYGSMLLGLCCRKIGMLRIFYRKLWILKREGRLLEIVDQRLGGRYDEEEMLRLLNVALECLEPRVQRRPSMVEVLQTLRGEEREEPEPIFHIEISP